MSRFSLNQAELLAKYPPALTAEQVSEILQIPAKTVYDLGVRGKLPRVKLGRTVRFPKVGILEILNPSSSKVVR